MKRALIVTDAWSPQTNGVVTTLQAVIAHLPACGYEVEVVHPGAFDTLPLPSYPEIRVARNPWRVADVIVAARPDTVHIATEGPLGLWARGVLCRHGLPFTTSLHTKFPEYVQARTGLPRALGYRFLRWFHAPAEATLCTTRSHVEELAAWGLQHLVVWGRGVDLGRFQPRLQYRLQHRLQARLQSGLAPADTRRPRLLYVGRVAVEKNLDAFLRLPIDADKIVVGDGPARAALERAYPEATWLGYRHGAELVEQYRAADAFVFPSCTDTFGLVMLEAMACGTPVAAYPVTGPRDVVLEGVSGALDADLAAAVERALRVDRASCRAYAESHSWAAVAARMAATFAPIDWDGGVKASAGWALSPRP